MRKNNDDEVKRFHKRVVILSDRRSQREAYELCERRRKKLEGERLYKNYKTYKNCISKRRKTGKV